MNTASLTLDPRTLRRNPWNPNRVDPENLEKLKTSLSEFGQFKPVVVRELPDGDYEILGGEHRNDAAIALGWDSIAVFSLGQISDEAAKKISLADNTRYGEDDEESLALLLKELDIEDMSAFMPMDEEITEVFAKLQDVDLDDLDDLDDDDDDLESPDVSVATGSTAPPKTHQIMRFKVSIEDAAKLGKLINKTRSMQGFTDSDELTNAGDALVYLLTRNEEESAE